MIVIKDDYDELAQALEALPKDAVIGFDGYTSAGKTPLAKEMKKRGIGEHIECDEYIVPPQKRIPYADCLNDRIYRDIQSVQSRRGQILLDAVCMREVCRRLKLDLSCAVYVKRIGKQHSQWQDETQINEWGPEHSISLDLYLHYCIDRYHECEDPIRKADIVFELTESD